MSQNDYTIANQSATNFRSDLNNALQALASQSSGATEPSTTYSNMLWYDSANNILKMRNEADDTWIDLFDLDQSGGLSFPSAVPQVIDQDNFSSNSPTRPPSQQSTKAYVDALPFTAEYSSSAQTIVDGGTVTLSHGLGAEPKLISVFLECVIASASFSVGERIVAPTFFNANASEDVGIGIRVTSTQVIVTYANSTPFFVINPNGDRAALINDNWRMYVRAFA